MARTIDGEEEMGVLCEEGVEGVEGQPVVDHAVDVEGQPADGEGEHQHAQHLGYLCQREKMGRLFRL